MKILIGLGLALGAVGHIEAGGNLALASAMALIGIALATHSVIKQGQ